MTAVSGNLVFFYMDSRGLPLDLIQELLREHELGFDFPQFVRACLKSGNYSRNKVERLVREHAPVEGHGELLAEVGKVYGG